MWAVEKKIQKQRGVVMVGVGKSNVGMLRPRNEDSILVSNEAIGVLPNVFVVADGMGGHKAGNVASASAIEGFTEFVKKPENENEEVLDVMISAVSYANELVHKLSQEHEEYSNMGSTFIACCIDNKSAYIAHVGDSRLYLYRDGELNQITNDHSLVAEMVRAGRMTEEEAETDCRRNVITRAVGTDCSVNIDGIIMCSDGLSNMVAKSGIKQILDMNISDEEKVDALISEANDNGGADNISVIIIGL